MERVDHIQLTYKQLFLLTCNVGELSEVEMVEMNGAVFQEAFMEVRQTTDGEAASASY